MGPQSKQTGACIFHCVLNNLGVHVLVCLTLGLAQAQGHSDQTQWNNGGYYGYPAQGYEAYGYAPPAQDPAAYYGAYPGYGSYQQPQQVRECHQRLLIQQQLLASRSSEFAEGVVVFLNDLEFCDCCFLNYCSASLSMILALSVGSELHLFLARCCSVQ